MVRLYASRSLRTGMGFSPLRLRTTVHGLPDFAIQYEDQIDHPSRPAWLRVPSSAPPLFGKTLAEPLTGH